VDGKTEVAGAMTHMNRPLTTWWEDGNLGPGMGFSPATVDAEISVGIYSDIGRTDLITEILLADTIEFIETQNVPVPVDDLFFADIPVLDHPFSHAGQDFTARLSLFHPTGDDLDSIQTDFYSAEGGDNTGYIALRITSNPIPEPTSYFALGLILGAILAFRRYSNGRHRTVRN
jgi:hypothetical protein